MNGSNESGLPCPASGLVWGEQKPRLLGFIRRPQPVALCRGCPVTISTGDKVSYLTRTDGSTPSAFQGQIQAHTLTETNTPGLLNVLSHVERPESVVIEFFNTPAGMSGKVPERHCCLCIRASSLLSPGNTATCFISLPGQPAWCGSLKPLGTNPTSGSVRTSDSRVVRISTMDTGCVFPISQMRSVSTSQVWINLFSG